MTLKAGMPVFDAIVMMRDESSSRTARESFTRLTHMLAHGARLSHAMESLQCFDVFVVDMVRVGEASGTLLENCMYGAEELRRRSALRRTILGAMMYPAIVAVATVGMTLGITLYIFPKIEPVFRSFHHALPLSTRIVLWVSSTLLHQWWWVLLMMACVVCISIALWRRDSTRMALERTLLFVPVLNTLLRDYILAQSSRTAGLLLSGGMAAVSTLEIVAESAPILIYRHAFYEAGNALERGNTLAQCLAHSPHLFPSLYVHMLAAGEKTGSLTDSLLYLGELYENELTEHTKRLTELLEPLLMITMGVIVGFLAISIITPIYGITQNLGEYH